MKERGTIRKSRGRSGAARRTADTMPNGAGSRSAERRLARLMGDGGPRLRLEEAPLPASDGLVKGSDGAKAAVGQRERRMGRRHQRCKLEPRHALAAQHHSSERRQDKRSCPAQGTSQSTMIQLKVRQSWSGDRETVTHAAQYSPS